MAYRSGIRGAMPKLPQGRRNQRGVGCSIDAGARDDNRSDATYLRAMRGYVAGAGDGM